MLALRRTDDNAIMVHATAADGGGFPFPLRGGPPNDPGYSLEAVAKTSPVPMEGDRVRSVTADVFGEEK